VCRGRKGLALERRVVYVSSLARWPQWRRRCSAVGAVMRWR